MYDYLIVGAGFAGAVAAERIATQLNKKVLIVEKRSHIGGNAFDEADATGILIHKYGPHIFHTNSKAVFEYLSAFTEWHFYEHRVLARLNGETYPMPINRITLNKLYGLNLSDSRQAEEYLLKVRENRTIIRNSEDIMVSKIGRDLFEKFFRTYTEKQWGLPPSKLSSSVCGRIPVRTNEDCRYFSDKYQFMPKQGFTKMFERMLENPKIEIALNTDYKSILNDIKFKKMIYTGPVDEYFDFGFGKLDYRSLEFKTEYHETSRFQDAAVVNYVDESEKFTRITEFKHFLPVNAPGTAIMKEFPGWNGEPYYPVLDAANTRRADEYRNASSKISNVLFLGRLAEYRYYNMDQVAARVLTRLRRWSRNQ